MKIKFLKVKGTWREVADAARTYADVELYEVRAGDREKLHVRLAGDRLCKQGLTCARRADKQNALRYSRADRGVLLRVAQEVHDLFKLSLFLICSCDVCKCLFLGIVLSVVRLSLAEAAYSESAAVTSATGCGAEHNEPEDRHNDEHGEIRHKAQPPRIPRLLVIVILENSGVELLIDKLAELGIEKIYAQKLVDDGFGLLLTVGLAQLHYYSFTLNVEVLDVFLLELAHHL